MTSLALSCQSAECQVREVTSPGVAGAVDGTRNVHMGTTQLHGYSNADAVVTY